MARKPAHLEMVGGKSPRQHIWEAIRKNRKGFTRYTIARRSGQDDTAVKGYISGLMKAGYIAHAREFSRLEEVTYHLVRDNGVEAPNLDQRGRQTRAGLATEAIWRTLRILGPASALQVASYASACGNEVKPSTVERYCADLLRAGYLERSESGYRLLPRRYTGPKPPIVQKRIDRQVYDPNLDRVVWAPCEAQAQPEPPELTWLRIENERLRGLLGEWLGLDDWADELIAPKALVERTQAEVQP